MRVRQFQNEDSQMRTRISFSRNAAWRFTSNIAGSNWTCCPRGFKAYNPLSNKSGLTGETEWIVVYLRLLVCFVVKRIRRFTIRNRDSSGRFVTARRRCDNLPSSSVDAVHRSPILIPSSEPVSNSFPWLLIITRTTFSGYSSLANVEYFIPTRNVLGTMGFPWSLIPFKVISLLPTETILQGGRWRTEWYQIEITVENTCSLSFILFFLEI